MRTRVALTLSSLVVAALAVSGCGAPTPTPAPTTTSTETPSSLEAPLSRLPLGCDELLNPSTVDGFVGEPVSLLADGTSANSWWDVVWRHAGGIRCEWGRDRDNLALSVSVVPNARSAFEENLNWTWPSYYERYDAVGDRSVHSC